MCLEMSMWCTFCERFIVSGCLFEKDAMVEVRMRMRMVVQLLCTAEQLCSARIVQRRCSQQPLALWLWIISSVASNLSDTQHLERFFEQFRSVHMSEFLVQVFSAWPCQVHSSWGRRHDINYIWNNSANSGAQLSSAQLTSPRLNPHNVRGPRVT